MELAQWLFFGPAKIMALWPYSGAVIAVTLIVLQAAANFKVSSPFDRTFFRKAPVFTGLLWLIFGFYEMQIQAVLARPVGSDMQTLLRLDLIVLSPILYLMSALAIYSLWRAAVSRP